jgi:two-component sensor histidine kinase
VGPVFDGQPDSRINNMLPWLKVMRGWPVWVRLALTTFALLGAYAFQIPLETEVPGEPFLLFFLVVVAATLAFGEAAGLSGTGLSTFLSLFFFTPGGTMALSKAGDLVEIELYGLLTAGCVIGFARLARASINMYDANEALRSAEQEKSVLLREVGHRVANNFATVASLMRRRSDLVQDVNAKSVLDDAVEQVIVMSRIHNRLRPGDTNVSVDSEEFILGLGDDLQESMARARGLTIECNAVSRPLSLAEAVPLGLILNELVTNAIKYAFPDGRSGTIQVSLEECGSQLCLTVEDSGIGTGPRAQGTGLGRQLTAELAKQLRGRLEQVPSAWGSAYRLTFPCPRAAHFAAPQGQPVLH